MEKLFRGVFCICFVSAAAAILILNGYMLALIATVGIWMLLRRKTLPYFTLILLIGGIVLRIAVLLALHPPLESDFLLMFQAASDMRSGDMSFNNTAYFVLWAYQSVFVAWEAMWLWNTPLCIELVNSVLSAGVVCLLYRMVRGWVSESAAQVSALMLTFFPFVLTFHTVLSNQIPSAFFLTLGLWLLVCADCDKLGFWRFPLSGMSLQFGNLLRCEGIIFLVAVLAWGVFETLNHHDRTKRILMGLLVLIAVYFAVNAAANVTVRACGLNPNGIRNSDPGWKFVTGLNFNSCGGYSADDWALIVPTLDGKFQVTPETKIVQNELIAQRLSAGFPKLLKHMINKIDRQWCTDGLSWVFAYTQKNATHSGVLKYTLIRQFDRGLFFLALGLALLGISGIKKDAPAAVWLPYFVFFAAFCAFLLIEIQARYAYLPQLYIFTAAAFGLEKSGDFRQTLWHF